MKVSFDRIVVMLKVVQNALDATRAFQYSKSQLSLIRVIQRGDEQVRESFDTREETANAMPQDLYEGTDRRLLFGGKSAMASKSD